MARTSDESSSERGPLQQEIQIPGCTSLYQVCNVSSLVTSLGYANCQRTHLDIAIISSLHLDHSQDHLALCYCLVIVNVFGLRQHFQ